MRIMICLLFLLLTLPGRAQWEVTGTVLDHHKEPVIGAVVIAFQYGAVKGSTITDYDGNYRLKPLPVGLYDVLIVYDGYDSLLTDCVVVSDGRSPYVNASLQPAKTKSAKIERQYREPLIRSLDSKVIGQTEDIVVLPVSAELTDVPKYQMKRNGTCGASSLRSGNIYVIDAVQVLPLPRMVYAPAMIKSLSGESYTFKRDELLQMPIMNLNDVLATLPGTWQPSRAGMVSTFGSRVGQTLYIMDGIVLE